MVDVIGHLTFGLPLVLDDFHGHFVLLLTGYQRFWTLMVEFDDLARNVAKLIVGELEILVELRWVVDGVVNERPEIHDVTGQMGGEHVDDDG